MPALRGDPITLLDSRLVTILERQEQAAKDIAALRSDRHGATMLAVGVGLGAGLVLLAVVALLLLTR